MMFRDHINMESVMDTCDDSVAQLAHMKQPLINKIADHVFDDFYRSNNESNIKESHKPFKKIWSEICEHLNESAFQIKANNCWSSRHRLGPSRVSFNSYKQIGSFEFKDSGLEISSKENFSTICANTCVFKGKWQYEAVLGSKGVMQIGWATLSCDFSQENGVGDTPDSYAYDGNRQRKWNVATEKYGEVWHCGDVISCTIDLDEGNISYFRNGRPLGMAFGRIQLGPSVAYFPALSLAIDQTILMNFGETPFCYPQKGFQPLQKPPNEHVFVAEKSLHWFNRLVDLTVSGDEVIELVHSEGERKESRNISVLIIVGYIGRVLTPTLSLPYVIESVLVPTLTSLSELVSQVSHAASHDTKLVLLRAKSFFGFLMVILEEENKKKLFGLLIMCLQRRFCKISCTVDYVEQKSVLKVLHFLFSESSIRKFCLKNILLEKTSYYRIISFVSVQCFDLVGFKDFAKIEFWSNKNGKFCHGDRQSYERTIKTIKEALTDLQNMQIGLLELLLKPDDSPMYNDSSRALFLAKFRSFIKDRMCSRLMTNYFVSPSMILPFFHTCFSLFIRLWMEEVEEDLGKGTVPPSLFYDGNLDYFDVQRLGGLDSHLRKKYAAEREQAIKNTTQTKMLLNPLVYESHCSSDMSMESELPSTSGAFLGETLLADVENVKQGLQRVNMQGIDSEKQSKRNKEELRTSLLHFLDGVVLLYYHRGHKQMDKILAQTDAYFDNVSYLEELLQKKQNYLDNHKNYSPSVVKELDRSISVIESNLREQSYIQVWNVSNYFSMDNLEKTLLFSKLIVGALNESSQKGGLFSFVPDFYVEVLIQLCRGIRCLVSCNQDDKNCSSEDEWSFYLPGGYELPKTFTDEYMDLLKDIAEFLALHFNDPRVVYADSKDSLIQSLAKFVCHKPGLRALENMTVESRHVMVKSLLQPYENRAWAQNNWILVRFWKGNGYAFRFTRSPHLDSKLGPKPAHCDIPNIIHSSAPFSSEVFLNVVSEVLGKPEISTPFVNSLLNQLNWVFSEFIGMLQEIQNASNRPERVFIDSRQLRICATCFDLALALLRVLEMLVNRRPSIFIDQNSMDATPLLMRLCQLLCQVLNRVSVGSGCFSHVVNLEIPGLETIHYFPILTAVVGIICELMKNDIYSPKADPSVSNSPTKFLLREASFQIGSLYSLLGGKGALKPFLKPSSGHASTSSNTHCITDTKLNFSDQIDLADDDLFLSSKCECKHLRFCFRNYTTDISNGEIKKLVNVLRHLEEEEEVATVKDQQNPSKVEDSDSVCTICYANSSDTTFDPCGHSSCTTCITHYLMNRNVCFFCKKTINQVKDISGKLIYITPSVKGEVS